MGERTGDSQEVDGEVRVESNQEDTSTQKEEVNETIEDSPLELVKEEEEEVQQKEIEEKPIPLTKEEIIQDTSIDLPEGVDKLIKFMEDTGGNVEDYTKLK